MTPATGRWENTDLIRRLCFSLDIAKETIAKIGETGFCHPDQSNFRIGSEKIIAETAFVLMGAYELQQYSEVSQKVNDLAIILCPYARNDKTLFNIALHPALALDYAYPHICLTKMGYPDDVFECQLTKLIDLNSKAGCERLPYRIIEQEAIKKIWNKRTKPIDEIVQHTSLGQSIDLLHGTREDMYGFTHAMIYTSSFRFAHDKLLRSQTDILSEADGMLARCLDEQDYDLAAELLLSWPLTRAPWSITAAFTFHVLAAVEDEIGFLPSKSIQSGLPKKLSQRRTEYLLATTYHTIYMMGYLCSTILRYDQNPVKKIKETSLNDAKSKTIILFLNEEESSPAWLKVYHQLTEGQKNSIIPIIFDILIIRNVRKMKFDFVYELLKIGLDIGLADTAVARQTAELIQRINIISN